MIEAIETLNNHPLTILKVSFADIVKKDIGEIGVSEKVMELLIQNKKAKQQAVLLKLDMKNMIQQTLIRKKFLQDQKFHLQWQLDDQLYGLANIGEIDRLLIVLDQNLNVFRNHFGRLIDTSFIDIEDSTEGPSPEESDGGEVSTSDEGYTESESEDSE